MNPLSAGLMTDGVLLRREAVELGIDDEALTRWVRVGVLTRIRQGAYVGRQHWEALSPEQRHDTLVTAVLRLYGPSAMLSHTSAVLHHGGPSWGLDLRCVDVTHPAGNGRTQARVHHHRGERQPEDVRRADGFWVTSPERTVIESAVRTGSVEVGVVIASDFLHRRLVSAQQLRSARLAHGRQPGALLLRTMLALADARLESVAESRCWYVLNRSALPPALPQYPVRDDLLGTTYRVDFAIPELGVIVEVDGREKYERCRRRGESLHDYLMRERRRENRIRELTGWEIIRFTWADLNDPHQIIERIGRVARRAAS